jgi:phage regulator Rha-like protein
MNYVFKIAVIISAYIVVSIMGAYFIKLMLRRYEKEVETSGLRGAGMVIGIVERIMVLTFVLVNQYTAITVIFAAKSIARFNELKDRKMAEYYLIGTLASITFALLVGIVVRAILVGGI